ncbi:hypothetical protein ACXGQW_01945 [Wenyingzhuangia sp. IMCC45533]
MKTKTLPYILIFLSILSVTSFAQEKEVRTYEKPEQKSKMVKRLKPYKKKEKFKVKKLKPYSLETNVDKDFYSVFTDFRIPVRENVNESDLLDEGWTTEEGRYAFRCKNEERVRLTFWALNVEDSPYEGSEFINVTHESDTCDENDITYSHKAPKVTSKKFKSSTKKRTSTEEKTPKEDIVTKFKKETKKKKKKAWEGVKK